MPQVTEPSTTATVPRPIVMLGSRVRVRDTDGEHEYTMVARVMAGAPPECVSIGSPVGSALLGRRLGDQVQVTTPGGIRLLTVVDVASTDASSSADSARTCEA
jgi:transcription elongation factor GreA